MAKWQNSQFQEKQCTQQTIDICNLFYTSSVRIYGRSLTLLEIVIYYLLKVLRPGWRILFAVELTKIGLEQFVTCLIIRFIRISEKISNPILINSERLINFRLNLKI